MTTNIELARKKGIVRKYMKKGSVFVCSCDPGFVSFVRRTLKDVTGETEVSACTRIKDCVGEIKKRLETSENVLLFMEKSINGEDSVGAISRIKEAFDGNVKIVIICREPTRHQVVLAFEKGADNVIGLPISADNFTEKVANTIVPMTAFTRKVHECKGLIADGKTAEAKRLVLELRKEKKDSCICRIMMGDIEVLDGNVESAETHYLAACSIAPEFLDPLSRLVDLYVKTGQIERKLDILKKLDSLSPLNHERKIAMGSTYVEMGDEEAAILCYEKAVSLVRKEAENKVAGVYMEVAQGLRASNPDKAVEYMEKAISSKARLTEEDMWMFNNMGILLRQEGRLAEARACYQRALAVSHQAEIHYNIGRTHMDEGEMKKAVKSFASALHMRPTITEASPRVPFDMGKALFMAGDADKACPMLKIALNNDISPAMKKEAKKMLSVCMRKAS